MRYNWTVTKVEATIEIGPKGSDSTTTLTVPLPSLAADDGEHIATEVEDFLYKHFGKEKHDLPSR